jgi:hypothetical protein
LDLGLLLYWIISFKDQVFSFAFQDFEFPMSFSIWDFWIIISFAKSSKVDHKFWLFWFLSGCLTCWVFLFLLKVAKNCIVYTLVSLFWMLWAWSGVFRFLLLLLLLLIWVTLAYVGNSGLLDQPKIASVDVCLSKILFYIWISVFGKF